MIRIIARIRRFAGTVAFWRVEPEPEAPVYEPVPPPPPVCVTVADVATAKAEGPIIPSEKLMEQLHGYRGWKPPKPWSYRNLENELTHRARLRATP